MLALPHAESCNRWRRAAQLLLNQADVADVSHQVRLAFLYDAQLDLKACGDDARGGRKHTQGRSIMFGFGSRQKFQMAQMALQEALAQLENTMRERDAYLQQRDIAIGERNLALAEIERLKRQAHNPG